MNKIFCTVCGLWVTFRKVIKGGAVLKICDKCGHVCNR